MQVSPVRNWTGSGPLFAPPRLSSVLKAGAGGGCAVRLLDVGRDVATWVPGRCRRRATTDIWVLWSACNRADAAYLRSLAVSSRVLS